VYLIMILRNDTSCWTKL